MDDKPQRERLEQELRFLKESFEAEVISKEEFEKGKDRVERKLKEIKTTEKETPQPASQPKEDNSIEQKTEGKIKLKVIQDEEEHHHEHEQEPLMQIKTEQAEKIAGDAKETKSYEEEFEKPKSKAFKYGVVFVVLVLAIFFSYRAFQDNSVQEPKQIELKSIACYFDKDCKQEGKIGVCLEPGSADAKCEFRDIIKTNVMVLNDRKNCFNCDTQRILDILKDWFDEINVKDIEYNTLKGKEVAQKFEAEMLPMYILDENITQKPAFEQFKQSFAKKADSYVLSDNAAGATFYVKRENVANKLDFFVKENDAASINAEKNLQEFLDNFKEVKLDRHNADDALTKELEIKTFPTFLVNSRVKFGGIQPAETIKENFCKLNSVAECDKTLSTNLV